MPTDKKSNRKHTAPGKLSHVILEYLFLSAAISGFTFLFLYTTAASIGENYFIRQGIGITEIQDMVFHVWLRSICIIASIIIFIILFLFMLGQRLSYLIEIIHGVEKLQQNKMDHFILPEGNDELTQLAESINYLSATQRDLTRREQQIKEEREALIRSLSHDIRTPLTSMLSYTEFMRDRKDFTKEEIRSYIELIYQKTLQIRHLSSRLMNPGKETFEEIDSICFLMEQLVSEWESVLEDRFECRTEFVQSGDFRGMADVVSLRRIIDNLVSNTEKYADPRIPVALSIDISHGRICITQSNGRKPYRDISAESNLLGLDNIRKIAGLYDGDVTVKETDSTFTITIILNLKSVL